jgi:hypothetical protein
LFYLSRGILLGILQYVRYRGREPSMGRRGT